jgi:Fe-S cluster assembly iron-binding protein IscA
MLMKKISAALVLCVMVCFAGCASFSENVDANRMLVMAGTMKAIEQGDTADERHYRAQSAIEYVEKTRTWLDLEKLTLAELQIKLESELMQTQWDPSDKIIAGELIRFVIQKLDERVIDGVKLPVTPEDAKYQVNTVLDWVETAAKFY